MVLSNKKLKQKLRATLTQSLVTKDSAAQVETSHSNKSFRELLASEAPKPRLSKREKRRKISSLQPTTNNGDTNTHTEENKGVSSSEVLKEKKGKKRKRKAVESESQGILDSKEEAEKKKKKPSAKKLKNKKKNKKKKNKEKAVEPGNAVAKEEQLPMEYAKSEEKAEAATKVYVGGIPYYSTEDDIRSFFESCGTITELDCLTFPETGKFRGIAMITFKTEAAAKRALALDGADMGGLFLKIQPHKAPQAVKSPDFAPKIIEGYNRIYVGNLSWDITEDDLRNLFSDCKISTIRFGEDKTTGEFRGYAHVDFSDSLSVTIALKLDQTVVCGRPVKVSCAVPKKEMKSKTDGFKDKKADNDSVSTNGGGKKRRTCYECGVPGHISSACPKKQAPVPVSSS